MSEGGREHGQCKPLREGQGSEITELVWYKIKLERWVGLDYVKELLLLLPSDQWESTEVF